MSLYLLVQSLSYLVGPVLVLVDLVHVPVLVGTVLVLPSWPSPCPCRSSSCPCTCWYSPCPTFLAQSLSYLLGPVLVLVDLVHVPVLVGPVLVV